MAVESQKVEFHPLAVRNRGVGQDLKFLRDEREVLVADGLVRCLGMDDEEADHSHRLLHRDMGVVEERPMLVNGELVYERLAGRNEILDQAGKLYGTTTAGGSSCGCGVVYQLSPQGDGSWKYILLHTFTGPDGILPDANLTLGPDGKLYGTTVGGGPPGHAGGVVFQLTP